MNHLEHVSTFQRTCWLFVLTLALFFAGFVGAAEAAVFDNDVR